MQTCVLCDFECTNNLAGQLSKYVQEKHSLTIEEYIIARDYEGVAPVCACGYCSDRPAFRRGRFSKFALGHNTFEYRERQHILTHGAPRCRQCGIEVGFCRGKPKSFCSFACSGKQCGFSLSKTQDEIARVIKDRYGVDNISKLEIVKKQISASHSELRRSGKFKYNTTEESHLRRSIATKLMWQDDEFRSRTSQNIRRALSTPEVRQKRRELLIKRFELDVNGAREMRLSALRALRNRFSKLHLKAEKFFQFREHGF